jgi:Zn finger protein HypA/HybF involved in hydrogenase expression
MKSTEKFIEESKLIHKNNYSYENVKYKGNRIDVIITCEKHGNFNQKPYNHLMGKGCPSCAGNKKITKDIFLKRSKFKHGDRYDYSLVDFESINKNVIIICKKHGNFEQSPRKHINGSGCPKCGGSERSNTKDFIKRSNIKHNIYMIIHLWSILIIKLK